MDKRSAKSSTAWRAASSVVASYVVSRVSTVAIRNDPRSLSVPASCPVPTVLPCSHVVKAGHREFATLGTERDAQNIDELTGNRADRFMLRYNFPPYCVGETGMMGGRSVVRSVTAVWPSRGVAAVMPSAAEFPYVVRVVSEITESNGSSSMASVCGSSLALMDAGVLIKASVAGIATGLVKEEEGFVVLSDILGDEDHLGDMDFGSRYQRRCDRAADGHQDRRHHQRDHGDCAETSSWRCLHILKVMDEAIQAPRAQISRFRTAHPHPSRSIRRRSRT